MRKQLVFIPVVTVMVLASCHQTNEVVDRQSPRISLSVTNLQPLGPAEGHYALWATFLRFNKAGGGDSPQHTSGFRKLGEFNLKSGDQTLYDISGTPVRFKIPDDENAQLLDDAVITVDTGSVGANDSLSGSIIIGGKFSGDAVTAHADLEVSYADAFGVDFSGVTGKCTIMAPTSPADSNAGIWFVDRQDSIVAGLRNLPVLPDGWTYEGWVGSPAVEVHEQKVGAFYRYFSTGKFLRPDSADVDGAGPGKGSGAGLNFPGQDFINAYPGGPPGTLDLRYFVFMISVEPEPDNSPSPFALPILFAQPTSTPFLQGVPISMTNVAASSLPRARLTIVRSGY